MKERPFFKFSSVLAIAMVPAMSDAQTPQTADSNAAESNTGEIRDIIVVAQRRAIRRFGKGEAD